MNNYSSGPWIVRTKRDKEPETDHNGHLTVMDSRSFFIASIHSDADEHHAVDSSEQLCNARLIAAAPDLLEALENLLTEPMAERTVDAAKRAIKKAKGAA